MDWFLSWRVFRYCKSIYQPDTPTSSIFLTLLRIYLRPTSDKSVDFLQPALDLISRHGPRLDTVETLQLLPPLVTAQNVKQFLMDALREPIFDTRVVREINKARNVNVARKLMILESKRVRVTDSRMWVCSVIIKHHTHTVHCFRCPQCHKRIGNSVIAVHVPR